MTHLGQGKEGLGQADDVVEVADRVDALLDGRLVLLARLLERVADVLQ